jgi:hypothetical protein
MLVSNYSVKQQKNLCSVLLNLLKFLGAFQKLRRATIIFAMSVSPSARPSVIVVRLYATTRLPLDGFS